MGDGSDAVRLPRSRSRGPLERPGGLKSGGDAHTPGILGHDGGDTDSKKRAATSGVRGEGGHIWDEHFFRRRAPPPPMHAERARGVRG